MSRLLGASLAARLASLSAIVLFLSLAVHQAAKPLHLDAMDFPAVAKATAESGKPIYYRGEQNPNHSGLYHPPLYIYTLAGWFKVFGSGPFQARLFGAACALLLGGTTLLLAGCFLRREELARIVPWFWPLFLLNPYALQGSAVPDIDTSVYGPLLTLLLWSFVRLRWRGGIGIESSPSARGLGLVALLFALCLWAKLTTILAFVPFLVVLGAAQWGWRRGAPAAALALLAGSGLFLATYWGYGRLLGLDTTYSYAFLQQSFTRRGHLPNPFSNLLLMGRHLALWAGFFPWLAFGGLTLGVSAAAVRRREGIFRPAAVVLALQGAVLAYYCARALTFSGAPFKYVFVSFGAVAFGAAALVVWASSRARLREGAGAGAGATSVVPALLAFALGGAAAYFGAHEVADLLIEREWLTQPLLGLIVPPAVALLGFVLLAFRPPRARRFGYAVVLCGVGLHLGFGLGVALYQSDVSYSTTYDYGQQGLAGTVRYLRARTAPGDLITAMKDVGFLSGRPYVENFGALLNDGEARTLIEYWESGRVRYIVFTEGKGLDSVSRRPLLQDWIGRNARLVARIGHYRIYRPRFAGPQRSI